MPRYFFDTNVLLYAIDAKAPTAMRKRAANLRDEHMRRGRAVLSTQVLQEYFVNATRKLEVPAQIAREQVEQLRRMATVQVTPQLILEAIDLHRLVQVSFWDALMLRAAKAGGCAEMLSDDLNHGQLYDGVKVVNPFKD